MRARLLQAGVQIDAVSWIVRRWNASDLSPPLRDEWSAHFDGTDLANFARLSQADQMDHLAEVAKRFQRQTLAERVAHSAASTADPDLRWAAMVALDHLHDLVGFDDEVLLRIVKPDGKVRYSLLTDIDVELRQALIEVTTQGTSRRKLAQLRKHLDPAVNPIRKPVLHFFPNFADVDPATNGSVKALLDAGSAGVFNDSTLLKVAVACL